MICEKTVVVNPSGLHARPAAVFVQKAMTFESSITVKNATAGSDAKDAKSILSMMGLGIKCGNEVEICADGSDEGQAVNELVALVESGCGE